MNEKKIFCLAPWVHSHITMSKDRALCCVAKPMENIPLEVENFWNSELMKEVRLKMIQGKAPEKYCAVCLDEGTTSRAPYERFEMYREKEEELLSKTTPEGYLSKKPVDFDFRLENTCNLKCRMCNEDASSQIESLWKKFLPADDKRLTKVDEQRVIQNEKALPELLEALERGEIRRVYWASGEAFLQQTHWEFIKKAKEKGLADQISLNYNSNLSFPSQVFNKYLEELSSFKEVMIFGSLDGFKEIGEFIRDGLNWEFFQKNVETLTSRKYHNIKLDNFQMTLTLPALLTFERNLNYFENLNSELNITLAISQGISSLLSPLDLPSSLRRKLIERTLSQLKPNSTFYSFLRKINLEDESSKKPQEYYDLFIENHQLDLAGKRKPLLEFYSEYKETREWFHQILKQTFPSDEKGIQFIYDKENFLFLWDLKEKYPEMIPPLNFTGAFPSRLHKLIASDKEHFSIFEKAEFEKTKLKLEVIPTGLLEPLLINIIAKGFLKRSMVKTIDRLILKFFPHIALQAKLSLS